MLRNEDIKNTLSFHSPNPIDFRFSSDFFNQIPTAPGVFWMQDSRRNILYVGASSNLKKDLLYFKKLKLDRAPAFFWELAPQVKQIDWKQATDQKSAQQMMRILVKQCQPIHNRSTKISADLFLQFQTTQPQTLKLKWGEAPCLNLDDDYFGPFNGRQFMQKTYSSLVRWVWIVSNSGSPEEIPALYGKPLLKNNAEIMVPNFYFENKAWEKSLKRLLNGTSELFIDFGLRKIEKMPDNHKSKVLKPLFHQDYLNLTGFFSRYGRSASVLTAQQRKN